MYVIGIKKKLYGSENEVEWRYACVDQSGQKPSWTKLGDATTFSTTMLAKIWWQQHFDKLLADKNVLPDTVSVFRMRVEKETSLPTDFITREDRNLMENYLKGFQGSLLNASEKIHPTLFKKEFLPKIKAMIADVEGDAAYNQTDTEKVTGTDEKPFNENLDKDSFSMKVNASGKPESGRRDIDSETAVKKLDTLLENILGAYDSKVHDYGKSRDDFLRFIF